MAREISNTDDVIDSRDIIERIDELEDERQSLVDDVDNAVQTVADANDDTSALSEAEINEAQEALDTANDALSDWDIDNGDELKALKALAEEGEGSPDWPHGETLIRDSYWTEYVQQLLEDIGDLPKDLPHYIEIDWEATARNIQVDYFSVDFDGVEYWIRS